MMRIRSAWISAIWLAALIATGCPSPKAAPGMIILGDMEKPTGSAKASPSAHHFRNGTITLHGAGNEVVAFQALVQAWQPEQGIDVLVSDLRCTATQPAHTLPAARCVERFLAHYIKARDASYSWAPEFSGGIEPWVGLHWPDALVPFVDPYDPAAPAVATPFAMAPRERRNQSVWVDVWIPKGTPAGVYRGTVTLAQNGAALQALPLALTVHPFDLPDESHVEAWGEVYRENGVMFDSGVKFKEKPEQDWAVYKRYLQLAHAHRVLATHRAENGPIARTPDGGPADTAFKPWGDDWSLFLPYAGAILNGSVFSEAEGYRGPAAMTPPPVYPAPFPEAYIGGELAKALAERGGQLDPEWLATLRANAGKFAALAAREGWNRTRFIAYLLDEVDGQTDDEDQKIADERIAQIHEAMRQIQAALDEGAASAGAGAPRIDLIWTSHADAARWSGTPADLAPFLRTWAPNGHAVNLDFYKPLLGDPARHVWFYHSGQPAVGYHTINSSGIDMRLWGLLCARYNLDGCLLWAMLCYPEKFDDPKFNPYAMPNYKEEETRWGNGTMLYPGGRLTMIGAQRNIAGPIPSMRLKALRRGLQDFEYCWLARQRGHGAEVDRLLRERIQAAFSEAPKGRGKGRWSRDPADYDALREQLAALIITSPSTPRADAAGAGAQPAAAPAR